LLEPNTGRNDHTLGLEKEVIGLRAQVKKLKKMVLLNLFDSKQEMKEFINDIW
jgi:hypothetical protein